MATATPRMDKHGSHNGVSWRRGTLLAGVSLLAAPGGLVLAETTIGGHLGGNGLWTDNIFLMPPGQSKDGEIYQLLPGLLFNTNNQYLQATLDYEMQANWYAGAQHGHQDYQDGRLVGEGTLIPDWLLLDVAGALSQSVVDPALNANINLLFPTGNVADAKSLSGTPMIRHKFSWVELEASYMWGFVHYQPVGTVVQPLANTANENGNFKLSSVDPHSTVTWDALYQRQETRYTNGTAEPLLYELAQADIGWLVTAPVRLLAEGGAESNLLKSVSAGGLGESFWLAGFQWSPDPLNDLRLMAGHRFFGNAYQASWRHQSRLLTVQASYNEQATSTTNNLLEATPTQNLVIIPGVPTFQRVTTDAYLAKTLDARLALTGRLTEIGLQLTEQEQNYFTVAGAPVTRPTADQERAATLYISRQLGRGLQAALSAGVDRADLRESLTSVYNDRIYKANLTDLIGQRTTLKLSFAHYDRYGTQRFRVDVVTLGFDVSFGQGSEGAFKPKPIASGTSPTGTQPTGAPPVPDHPVIPPNGP